MDLDALDLGRLVPAALAAAACLLAVADPRAGLRRATVAPVGSSDAETRLLGRAIRGRPGAPSPLSRLGLGAVTATVLCLLATQLLPAAGWWPLLAWPLPVVGVAVVLGGLEPVGARRRTGRLVAEVPQALELMADGLAAGLPLRGACAAVVEAFDGPVSEELGSVLRSIELGVGEPTAWAALASHPQLGPAAVDLARSVESGTELVRALRCHAATARERRRAALQQGARSVGVRSVLPLMICFIPAFLLLGVVPTVVSAVLQAFG